MADMITYICKRTVVSTKPVQPGKYYPLSVLDRLMERNHIRMVFYYRSTGDREAGETTKKLRESLSEMLTFFPIVTGRLLKNNEGQWMIKCNDAGVRMVEARAKGSVDEWLKQLDREKELKLVHWEDMYHKPYFWSTFYVQLTEFEEGGLAVGLSCIQLLADPICATILIKSWADSTLTGAMISPPTFHPLPPRKPANKDSTHQPYSHLINHYKSLIEKRTHAITSAKQATITLTFTHQMVQACIDMALTTGAPDRTRPSPFEALASLFWVCLSKVKGMKEELINMSVCLDMRSVLGLDKGFFGNCMVYNKVSTASLGKNKLSSAAKAIGEVVAKMDNEGIMDLIEWLEGKDKHSPPLMNGCDLISASLEGVDPYLVTFEEGFSPIHVSYHIEAGFGFSQVLVLPSPSGDGPLSRVVIVTLPEDEVVKLCEDDLILRLSPTRARILSSSITKNG
ncbi:Transferase domain-containing protein [Cephalotus follicularis]|uniref:Transferase domain-containing protein n=1 Tax=Cephalotus follicularis TaxID=3775 RepID=A0A1Q3BRE7_CEPFO|nr:Transferase domain-containing protein [Cephalotus follicularis]